LHNINFNVDRRDQTTNAETAEFWLDDVKFLPR
jgi:hypothetical protein